MEKLGKMKNGDFIALIVFLIVVFFVFYKVVPSFIEVSLDSDKYSIGNGDCESDGECVVVNMDYSSCSCDMRAVNLEYAEYTSGERAEYSEAHDRCALNCELEIAECVASKCEIAN